MLGNDAIVLDFEVDGRLVSLDDVELVSGRKGVAGGNIPLGYGSRRHCGGKSGHSYNDMVGKCTG